MPTESVALVILIVLVVLVALILLAGLILALVLARRRPAPPPGPVCPQCKRALPPGAQQCTFCGWHRTPSPSPPPAQPSPYLLAEGGPFQGEHYLVQPPPGGLTLGRGQDNDVVLDSMMVSRHHAQVMPEGPQHILYDRDSANGTYVNDRRVYRHNLSVGDRIQIGDCQFTFVVPGQPMPKSPPPSTTTGDLLQQYPLHTVFEDYMLLELLGHGGMSVVFKAQDPAGNIVAIKILDVTDAWVARKFVQEGKIGAALQGHPHIRTVYDLKYGRDNHPYLVMEYVEGTSLRQHVGALMSPAEVVSVIGQVCEALDFAHQHDIVHRDVKPENILIGADGTVKVTDFGIAKLTSSVTVTKERIVGTPEYISPEQARGEEQVKRASDIYSLGVVLYETLTGRVPFPLPRDKDSYQAAYSVIRQHINDSPAPPSRLNPSVTPALERAALRALEKAPAKRFATAAEMALAVGYDSSAVLPLAPAVASKPMQLVILEGAEAGKVIPLAGTDVEIGRTQLDPANRQISRRHVIISRRGQAWWLQDVSRNGTWVNGSRVYDQVPLDSDALIEIGGAKLRLTPLQREPKV